MHKCIYCFFFCLNFLLPNLQSLPHCSPAVELSKYHTLSFHLVCPSMMCSSRPCMQEVGWAGNYSQSLFISFLSWLKKIALCLPKCLWILKVRRRRFYHSLTKLSCWAGARLLEKLMSLMNPVTDISKEFIDW